MQKSELTQSQSMKQIISQQTIQTMRLVEMNANSIELEIIKEVEENPALEFDDDKTEDDFSNNDDFSSNEEHNEENDYEELTGQKDQLNDDYDDYDDYSGNELDYIISHINQSSDDPVRETIAISEDSFQEKLINQLSEYSLSPQDFQISKHIIGCLDSSGYLPNSVDNIVVDLLLMYNIQTTSEHIEFLLKEYIQQLDPIGVGARSLQEFLIIQIEKMSKTPEVVIAQMILKDCFSFFSQKHFDKIEKKLNLSNDQLKKSIDIILKLTPRPIVSSSLLENSSSQITPDFIITIENDKLVLNLNNNYLPKIRLNKNFKMQYNFYDKNIGKEKRVEAEKFIKKNSENAEQFINSLNLRELILYNTMLEIMNRQKDYFFSGNDADLKPLILKDIAQVVKLDVSTISRVSNSKYVQTPFGIISLKHLFSEAVGEDGASSKEIKIILSQIIDNEDKKNPISDEELCDLLKEKGYEIARRTVAKYRLQLNIPVARLRKTFSD